LRRGLGGRRLRFAIGGGAHRATIAEQADAVARMPQSRPLHLERVRPALKHRVFYLHPWRF
jgi:hypothetical protein